MQNQREPKQMFRTRPLVSALLAAGYGAFTMSGASAAQEDVETIYIIDQAQETELASSKFTAPILDTPQTLAVISAEVFIAQGAQNLTDVLRNTPGISFSAGENGFATNTNNFSMRGFDTSGNIFTDGVRDSGNYSRDIFNLEQVEVIKGPAADNGRGGAGGYINMVTKSPQQTAFIRGNAGYGFDNDNSDGRLRTMIDANQPFSGGSSAGRLNILIQEGGVAGREHAERDSLGIAPSLAFGLGTDTRTVVAYQYLDQSGRPDWGVPAQTIDDMMRYDPVAAQADRSNFYGLSSDYDDNESNTLMFRIEHDVNANLGISNQTRWTKSERDAIYTLPTGYTPATQLVATQSQVFQREVETLSNLTSLTARFVTGGLQHNLAAGLEFSRENSVAGRFGTINPPATNIFNPNPDRAPGWNPVATEANEVDIDTIAVYVYDTIEFSPRWQITGGLRGEQYEVALDSITVASGAPQGPDGYEVDKSTVSGKIGLVFKPMENASIYAAVSSSALPPASFLSNPDISRTGNNAFPGLVGQNNQSARAQRAINYELGAKWNLFDERLATTVAIFETERENIAIAGKTPGVPASPTVLQGYGKQIVQGVELGVSGVITSNWSVFGGLLLLESERRHSAFLDAAVREANPGDYGTTLRTSGDELGNTPETTANLWTTYTLPALNLTLGGGLQYVDDSWIGRPDDADRIIPNGTFGKLPSYTVINLMASYQLSNSLFVRLNIDNISDELYATSSNWSAQRVFLGPPRSFLLSADFRF